MCATDKLISNLGVGVVKLKIPVLYTVYCMKTSEKIHYTTSSYVHVNIIEKLPVHHQQFGNNQMMLPVQNPNDQPVSFQEKTPFTASRGKQVKFTGLQHKMS